MSSFSCGVPTAKLDTAYRQLRYIPAELKLSVSYAIPSSLQLGLGVRSRVGMYQGRKSTSEGRHW